uniref:Cytohesin 1 interacting protein n=1 Tax=Gasterosteus aculeatus aculeatus TaxID=481459 RepID=G3NQT1_GASAC
VQHTMNFNGLQRQGSQENYILDNTLKKKCSLWYRRSLKGNSGRQNSVFLTLQSKQTRSLVDYSDPQRTTIVLEKQDNETFGFEIQTYGLQLNESSAVEMCTFVRKVLEDSAAENAGLTAGDIIVTINEVSIEGSSHQHILELIRDSTNSLTMETVCGNIMKQIELEKRVRQLKQTLREKLVELQALTLQETRLVRGNLNDIAGGPLGGSDDGSSRSTATEDSVFGDMCSPSPRSAASTTDGDDDDGCFFSSRDFPSGGSSLADSSGSLSLTLSPSPSWEEARRVSSLFGTLPRKSRRTSVRKHILKLIPGLQRSVEEEETGEIAQ